MADTVPEKNDTEAPLTPEVLVPRLGDYLVERGLLSETDLEAALLRQSEERRQGKSILIGEVLIELGLINRVTLNTAVTEQIIQLRAALQDTNQQLERRVQQRTQELQNALQKLSELNQLKSNFIANISHELRTPLTHIKGYVELLLSGAMGALVEQQSKALMVVQRSTERLETQIEDLIRFSLASRGDFTLSFVPFQLNTLVNWVTSRSLDKACDKNIELHTDIPTDLPLVRGDTEKLSWALIQLVDNAIKFTPEGGRVSLRATHTDGFAEIAVQDTGIGIPDHRFEEIFEPFHQLDGSATRRYGGTGLGLALVRQIVEAHGSSIQLESEMGRGTCFHFLLPIAEQPPLPNQ
ncbi:MAG: ATP-binding protein [Anaerolineaceae bacterium]|nr:ATP-binding protein [Anaerolineaceae bacterium]